MGRKTHGPYLIAAIEYNDLEKVTEILGTQVRGKEKIKEFLCAPVRRLAAENYEVPFLLAAAQPTPAIIRYMVIKHEVSINFVYREHLGPKKTKIKTALITAVRKGHYETVDGILSLSCDSNVQDHKGRTALHHAVRRADYRMAKMLLVRGAQVNLLDAASNSPLHMATIFGHLELVKLLLQYNGDLYQKGQHGAVPMHIAAREGHAALVRLYSNYEVNVNTRVPCYDSRDKAPLHVACEQGHSETALALLEYCGADVNISDSEKETPLHCTVINLYDPLGMKSKDDYAETVKILVRYGADVNQRNARGETALLLAARNEFQKIVDLLVQAGTDPLIEDNDGNKAIDLVVAEDTVSRQTLKMAMEEREKIMSESLELRAKGFSTSLRSLPIRSQSALNMAAALGSDIGRSSSQQRLFSSQHQLALALQHPTVYEDGYLPPVDSRHLNHANHGNPNQSHSSSSGSQGRPKFPYTSEDAGRKASSNSLKEESPISEGSMPPVMIKRAKSEDSLIGSPVNKNRNKGRALPMPPSGRGGKPGLETRESIMSKQSEAPSFWQVTPRASATSYQEDMSYESLPSQQLDKPTKEPAEKPLLFLAPGQQPLNDTDEDTFFDDESFDTLDDLDDKKTQKPSLPPKPRPKRNKPPEPTQAEIESHKKAVAQNDPNLQNWLTEQAVLLKQREQAKNAGPIAHSTPPRERAKKSTNLQTFQSTSPPPRPERNYSTSSADTVKENKPPPLSPKAKSSNKVHVNQKTPGQTLITIRPRREGDSTSTVTENTTTTEDVYSTTGRPISDISASTDASESTVVSSEISSVSQRREKNNNEPPTVKPRVARRTNPPKPPGTSPPPLPPKMPVKEISSSDDSSSSSYSESDSEDTEVLKKPPAKQPPLQPKPAAKKPLPPPKQPAKKPVPPPKKTPVKPTQEADSGDDSPSVSFSSGEEDEADSKASGNKDHIPTIKIQPVPKPETEQLPSQPSQPRQPTKAAMSLHQKALLGNLNKLAEDEDSVAMDYKFYKSNKEIITSSGSDIQVSIAKKLHDNEMEASQRQHELEQQRQQQLQYEQEKEHQRQEEMERKRQQEIERVRIIQQQAEKTRLFRQQQLEQQKLQQLAMEQHAQQKAEQERLQRETEQERLQQQQLKQQQQQAEQQRLQQQQAEQQRLQQEQQAAELERLQPEREYSPVQNGDFDDKQGKRKSVTIGSDTIIPTTPRKAKDHDHRTVNYNGAEPRGFKVVGGNAEGVFVHQLEQNSEARRQGLLDGDQILKINSQSMTGKTKEDATVMLMNIKTVVSLIVRNKIDRYQAILHHGGTGDSFHVRAKFNLDVKGELQVDEGDIFSVKDTLPDGRMGFWRATKVSGKHMSGEQVGLIPNKQRAEQIALAHQLQQARPVETVQRGGFLRRSFQKSRSRSKSVDRLGGPGGEHDPHAIHPGQIVPYEKVEQRSPGFRRPVFLLGLFCDVVKDMLLRDSPGIYEDPGGEVEVDTGGVTPSNQDPVNVRLIRSISTRDKHCLAILSPKAIHYVIEKTDLYPLVIYLSPGSKQIVKIQKGKMAPGFDRKPGYMYDEAMNFEKVHNKLFTATVPYTQDESWFLILKDTIDGIQKTPFWMPAKAPTPSDDEDEEEESPRAVLRAAPPSNTMPRMSRTTDDIPDQVQTVLNRHVLGLPLAGSSPTHAPSPGLGPSPVQGPALAQGPSPVRRPAQSVGRKPPTPTEEHYLPMSREFSDSSVQSPNSQLNGSQQNGAPRSILKNGQNGQPTKDGDSASQSSEHSASSSSQPSVIMGGSPSRIGSAQAEPPAPQAQRMSRSTKPIQRQIPQAIVSTRQQTTPAVQPLPRGSPQQVPRGVSPAQPQGAQAQGHSYQGAPSEPYQHQGPQRLPGQRPPFQGRPPYQGQQGYNQGPGPRQYRPQAQRYQGPHGPRGPRQAPPGNRYQGPRPRQPPPQGTPGHPQGMVFRPAGPPVQQTQQQEATQPSLGLQGAQMAAHPGYQQAGYNPQMVTTRRPSADTSDAHKETTL